MEIDRPYLHHHPLVYCEGREPGINEMPSCVCDMCGLPILSNPKYRCNSGCTLTLHEPCANLPYKLTPSHLSHPLSLQTNSSQDKPRCRKCGKSCCNEFIYSRQDHYVLHPLCATAVEINIRHESHEEHPLAAMCRESSSRCDACGEEHKGFFFFCRICDFWVHQKCASLPRVVHRAHEHSLVLMYALSDLYSGDIQCGICAGVFASKGTYCCTKCTFVAHLNCVINKSYPDGLLTHEDQAYAFERLPQEIVAFPRFTIRSLAGKQIVEVLRGTNESNTMSIQKYHDHALRFRVEYTSTRISGSNKTHSDRVCNMCIQPIDSTPFLGCKNPDCNFTVHDICTKLPSNIVTRKYNIPFGIITRNFGVHFPTYSTSWVPLHENYKEKASIIDPSSSSSFFDPIATGVVPFHETYKEKASIFDPLSSSSFFNPVATGWVPFHENYKDKASVLDPPPSSFFFDSMAAGCFPPRENYKEMESIFNPMSSSSIFKPKPTGFVFPHEKYKEKAFIVYPGSSGHFFRSIFECCICQRLCNGFGYAHENSRVANFIVDVECASAKKAIIHSSHKQNHILLMTFPQKHISFTCCPAGSGSYQIYRCGSCDFVIHVECALLPAKVRHNFDEHPLDLTFGFPNDGDGRRRLCEFCENEIDGRYWFYHCAECFQFFHVKCIPSVGSLSKIKFGGRLGVRCHPDHPVTLTRMLAVGNQRCGFCKRIIKGFEDEMAFCCYECDFWIHLSCMRYSYAENVGENGG